MYISKRVGLALLSALLLILFLPHSAAALEISSGDTINIPLGTIKGPLFVSGNDIEINADVDGDVFALGETVEINGVIDGDLIAAANSIRINGNILGDVRSAANTIDITGQIAGSFSGAANKISIKESSSINRDVLLMGSTLEILGKIEGQVMGSANQINLNGIINSDVTIWDVQKLILGPSAVIGGSVTYTSAYQAQIDYQAKVDKVTQLTPPVNTHSYEPKPGITWFGILWPWTAGILIWAVLCLIFPQLFPRIGKTASGSPWPSLGWGFLALLLIPLAAIVLVFTVIGIPLVMLTLCAYIITLCLAKIMVADLIGRWLVRRFRWSERGPLFAAFILSFLALILLTRIPVLSFFLNIIIASMALGMLILTISDLRRRPPEITDESGPVIG